MNIHTAAVVAYFASLKDENIYWVRNNHPNPFYVRMLDFRTAMFYDGETVPLSKLTVHI